MRARESAGGESSAGCLICTHLIRLDSESVCARQRCCVLWRESGVIKGSERCLPFLNKLYHFKTFSSYLNVNAAAACVYSEAGAVCNSESVRHIRDDDGS